MNCSHEGLFVKFKNVNFRQKKKSLNSDDVGKSWWSTVDHFLELLNCRKFHQLSTPCQMDGSQHNFQTLLQKYSNDQ